MVSPQKENGYVPIANEIMDALAKHRISGECWQIVIVILRKTYGFNKKEDVIAISQFVDATGMKKQNAWRSLNKLIACNVVIKSDYGALKFNKVYTEWKPFVIKGDDSSKKSSEVITPVIRSDDKVSSEVMNTKDNKYTIQKTRAKRALHGKQPKKKKVVEFNPLGAEVIKLFEEVDPVNKTYYGNTTQRSACDYLIKEYGFEIVKSVVGVLPKTNEIPYFPSITTPYQLKVKWTDLKNKIKQEQNKGKQAMNKTISNYHFTS